MTTPEDSKSCHLATTMLRNVAIAALLAGFAFFVWRHYEIRAYSDPSNWLHFARHFKTEFATSRWPFGFPLFLAGALRVCGPFWIFLVNAPMLALVFVLAARLAGRAVSSEQPGRAWAGMALAIMLFLRFDRWLVLQMVNPYRDPLSFAFVLLSAHLLITHIRDGGHRPGRVAGAGLLLGGACVIRETSILMIAPFALFAFWSWRAQRNFRLVRDGALFAAGVLAGLLPLAAQSLLSTGQALLPPQAAMQQTLVPGMNPTLSSARKVLEVGTTYFWREAGWWLLGLPLSIGLAWRQRNRLMLGLALPAILIYAVFYAFYWTFVRRYFYAGVLFAIPLLAWGILEGWSLLTRRLNPRLIRTLSGALFAAFLGDTLRGLILSHPPPHRFQIEQARRFTDDIQRLVPPRGLVFAQRPLCEILRWFTHARSFAATALIPPDVPPDLALDLALNPHWHEASPLYLLEYSAGSDREADAAILNRITEMQLLAAFPVTRYGFSQMDPAGWLRLYSLRPRNGIRPSTPWTQPTNAPLWRLDFNLQAEVNAGICLDGDYAPMTLQEPYPRTGPGSRLMIRLPSLPSARNPLAFECWIRGSNRCDQPLSVNVETSTNNVYLLQIPQNRCWHPLVWRMDAPAPVTLSAASGFSLSRLLAVERQATNRLELNIGSSHDFAWLLAGWHDRERGGWGEPSAKGRWTGRNAAVEWLCPFTNAVVEGYLRYHQQALPAGLAVPRIYLNAMCPIRTSSTHHPSGLSDLHFTLPAPALTRSNVLTIVTAPWAPPPGENRVLGVFVDHISLEAAPPRATPTGANGLADASSKSAP